MFNQHVTVINYRVMVPIRLSAYEIWPMVVTSILALAIAVVAQKQQFWQYLFNVYKYLTPPQVG